MESAIRFNDDLMCRGRILRREWKRYKPHLPRSISLPQLELVPAQRPLFTCQQCGFSNAYIPLCLWCSWTSPEAALAFVAATPRRSRRISGPGRVIWKDDIRREDQRPQESSAPAATSPNLGALRGSKLLVATNTLRESTRSAQSGPQSRRNTVVRATVRALGDLDSNIQQKPSAIRARRGLPEASVIIPSLYTTTTTSITSSNSPNVTSMSRQLKHTSPTHPVSLPPIVSPPHTLHRKHHMTFPRQKSTRSLRSRALAVPPPQPVPVVSVPRLGHPSRPYYTAIRPHFSNGGASSRPHTPTTPNSARLTSSDMGQSPPSPPPGRPSFEFTRPRRSTTSGWSLSGEIELQIALSQRRDGEDGGPHSSGKRGSIVQGVRKLGTGLRNLVLRRG
ncbi:hypothetical protein BJV78DRAFT_1285943 [Lactifluus subvellereus]|nr:hypothetical protein BJV78DRAFT_1285943 [Lactifluus subvellereus]